MIKYFCDKCEKPAPFLHSMGENDGYRLSISTVTMSSPPGIPSKTIPAQLCAKCVREIFGDYGKKNDAE